MAIPIASIDLESNNVQGTIWKCNTLSINPGKLQLQAAMGSALQYLNLPMASEGMVFTCIIYMINKL